MFGTHCLLFPRQSHPHLLLSLRKIWKRIAFRKMLKHWRTVLNRGIIGQENWIFKFHVLIELTQIISRGIIKMYTRRPHVKTNVRNVNYFPDRTFLPGVIHFNYVSTEFLTGTLIFFLLIIQFKVVFFALRGKKWKKMF